MSAGAALLRQPIRSRMIDHSSASSRHSSRLWVTRHDRRPELCTYLTKNTVQFGCAAEHPDRAPAHPAAARAAHRSGLARSSSAASVLPKLRGACVRQHRSRRKRSSISVTLRSRSNRAVGRDSKHKVLAKCHVREQGVVLEHITAAPLLGAQMHPGRPVEDSASSIRMRPVSGRANPAMQSSVSVLPAPLGPNRAVMPGRADNSMSRESRRTLGPPGKCFPIFAWIIVPTASKAPMPPQPDRERRMSRTSAETTRPGCAPYARYPTSTAS